MPETTIVPLSAGWAAATHDGLSEIEIGHARRERLDRRAVGPADRHVLENRRFDLREEPRHLLRDLAQVADVGERAAAELRRLRHEVAVGGGADAYREESRRTEPLRDQLEELVLAAHGAIGHEHDLAKVARRVAAIEREGKGAGHLGAAVGLELRDPGARVLHVGGGGGKRVGPHRARRGIEFDDVEAVAGRERGESHEERLLRLQDRDALHGAGGVDDEHRLARHRRDRRGLVRRGLRRHHHQKRVVDAVSGIGEGRGLRGRAGLRRPHELEVAIGLLLFLLKVENRSGARFLLDPRIVVGTRHFPERYAQIDHHADGHGVRAAARGDVVGVKNRIGRRAGGRGNQRLGRLRLVGDRAACRVIAGRHREREAQPVLAVVDGERLLVLDQDAHVLAGPDVGDRVGEEIGALLLDQRRFPAFALGLRIHAPRLFLFLHLPFDHAAADAKPQAVDGGVLGERKDVDALDPVRAGVVERLRHACPRHDSGDVDDDIGFDFRRRREGALGPRPEEEGAGLRLTGLRLCVRRRREPEGEEGEDHACGNARDDRLAQQRNEICQTRVDRAPVSARLVRHVLSPCAPNRSAGSLRAGTRAPP